MAEQARETEQIAVVPLVEEITPVSLPVRVTKSEISAWLLLAGLMLLVFLRHLVPAILIGLIFYVILHRISHFFSSRLRRPFVRPLALLTAVSLGGGIVGGGLAIVVRIIKTQRQNIPALMTKMASILESTRLLLIRFGGYEMFPDTLSDAEDMKTALVNWLKLHTDVLSIAGERFGSTLIHGLMAVLLAAMIFLRHVQRQQPNESGPLAFHLREKMARFTTAFAQVARAQLMISAINTTLTAVYLFGILPIAGKRLPFSGTIIFVTFVCGLIPVLGNLISNSVIVIVSLGISFGTAIGSMVFLVLVHKLEYIVNSRIVGSKTDSQAWEILMAIVIGDITFGIPGVVMGPILYTFIKRELRVHRQV
ncbi:MAG TPA: AI-2E family transporter [Thermoanaerobaculia bacterium]|nr:AI-2E family transporter [Thermoanaerobaculia bacterium]